MPPSVPRVFLLSPAKVTGKRAGYLLRKEARFELAVRLRERGASLGEVFSFMSGLYFRGKLAYANAFARPPDGVKGSLVITSAWGLVPAETTVSIGDLEALAGVPVDDLDERYVGALTRDARRVKEALGLHGSAVLLGSVATSKYLNPLSDALGSRLQFPSDFIGRGDLSRGGLLLRAVKSGCELSYAALGRTTQHGRRPSRLAPVPR